MGEIVADIRQRILFQRKIMGLKQEKKAMAFCVFLLGCGCEERTRDQISDGKGIWNAMSH